MLFHLSMSWGGYLFIRCLFSWTFRLFIGGKYREFFRWVKVKRMHFCLYSKLHRKKEQDGNRLAFWPQPNFPSGSQRLSIV